MYSDQAPEFTVHKRAWRTISGKHQAKERGIAAVLDRRAQRRRPFQGDSAAIEYIGVIGDAQREIEMLLDEDDADLVSQIAQPFGDLLDDTDPHALGRLVEQKSVGFASSARPIASILRSPPHRVPAVCSRRCASLGNIASMRSMPARSRLMSAPTCEVLAHRQPPEHRIFLRHVAETQPYAPLGRHARRVACRRTETAPLVDRNSPMIVFISVVFPAPLRPRTATAPRAWRQAMMSNRTWLRP